METVSLSSWTIIKVSGNDTIEYLNGIITLELLELEEDETRRAAFLSPQGKIKSQYWVRKFSDKLLLFCPPEMKTNLIGDLLKYKLSMEVTLEDISGDIEGLYLKRVSSSGIEGISSTNCAYDFIIGKKPKNTQNYRSFKEQMVLNSLLPPEFMLDEIPWEIGLADMVNLNKGCFLGQEPVSRMVNRGRLRKYLYLGKVLEKNPNLSNQRIEEVKKLITKVIQNETTFVMFFLNANLEHDGPIRYGNLLIEILQKVGQYPQINR